MKKIIIIVVLLALVLGVLFWKFGSLLTNKKSTNQEITLHLSGLWEDDSLIRPAIDDYRKSHSNVKIEYKHENSPNYRSRIQTQISDSTGPDILMIHDTWLPMFLRNSQLDAVPDTVMNIDDYKKTFYPVAEQMLTKNGKIYGIPLEVDGLALYYNEDLVKKYGIQVSNNWNWNEFREAAIKATEKDDKGNIIFAGVAMGTTGNVDHWSDILALLFLQQPGVSLDQPANSAGADVLRFYTNFVTNPQKNTWSQSFESSTEAFYTGKVAFYFGPSWRAHDIRTANQNLNFKILNVPQLQKKEPKDFVDFASFWAFAVSANSNNKAAAWDFIKFVTSKDEEKQLYQEASKVRLFGQPYSRVDLQQEIAGDIDGPFVTQGPIYHSWYLASNTFDQGINDRIITYFENAVNSTVQGGDPQAALGTTQEGIKQVLEEMTSPPTPAPSP